MTFRDLVESHLDSYRELGADFVIIYRLKERDDFMFVESYPSWEKYSAARRYWENAGYVVNKMWDLSYLDWLKEFDEADSRTQ